MRDGASPPPRYISQVALSVRHAMATLQAPPRTHTHTHTHTRRPKGRTCGASMAVPWTWLWASVDTSSTASSDSKAFTSPCVSGPPSGSPTAAAAAAPAAIVSARAVAGSPNDGDTVAATPSRFGHACGAPSGGGAVPVKVRRSVDEAGLPRPARGSTGEADGDPALSLLAPPSSTVGVARRRGAFWVSRSRRLNVGGVSTPGVPLVGVGVGPVVVSPDAADSVADGARVLGPVPGAVVGVAEVAGPASSDSWPAEPLLASPRPSIGAGAVPAGPASEFVNGGVLDRRSPWVKVRRSCQSASMASGGTSPPTKSDSGLLPAGSGRPCGAVTNPERTRS